MKLLGYITVLALFISCTKPESSDLPVDLFIGTGAHGHTHPSATTPFGMIQAGPVNGTSGWDWTSGYHYSDSVITGFAQTHLSGTGIGDLNDILIMPWQGEYNHGAISDIDGKRNYASTFEHENEEASPGYYSVMLDRHSIRAEMTSTDRTALYRFTYPKRKKKQLIVDLGFSLNWDNTTSSGVEKISGNRLIGWRYSSGWARDQKVYFAMELNQNFEIGEALVDSTFQSGDKIEGRSIILPLALEGSEKEILVKVAISGVSTEGAINNLETQSSWDFDTVKNEASEQWKKALYQIKAKGDAENLTKFYTALYRTKLAPILFSDIDGGYRGGDGANYSDTDSDRYTIYSLWDTFRAEHPLLTITDPDRVNDIINTMLDFYKETGLLPVWELVGNETNTMTGYHAIPVIVDAYVKGFRGFDAELAFEAMKASAMQDIRGTDLYREYGYIPSDLEVESVTKTLEYAYDDWCIGFMARILGKKDEAEYFFDRSESWKALYDEKTGFMRGKNANGSWVDPFDPLRANHRINNDYTEGNAWQHSWFVPHDVTGLIDQMGGNESFVQRLDSMFAMPSLLTGEDVSPDISGMIGQYAHGNEPSHHIAYLYNYAGMPWKTQERVQQIMDSLYTTGPEGLSGNEDCGQMSAWYVFSAMGLYPVNPAIGVYAIGSPDLDEVKINLGDGKSFKIVANELSKENIYIQSATLNGEELGRSYITHAEIMAGGELVFNMGNQPNKEWASSTEQYPINTIQ